MANLRRFGPWPALGHEIITVLLVGGQYDGKYLHVPSLTDEVLVLKNPNGRVWEYELQSEHTIDGNPVYHFTITRMEINVP